VNLLLRLSAIFVIAVKRLLAQWRLATLTALGLTVAVAMAMSVPLYADAVYGRTLNRTLLDKSQAGEVYPPYAFLFRQLANGGHPARRENIQAVDAYMKGPVNADLGLPQKLGVRFVRTENLGLFPANAGSSYLTIRNVLGLFSVGAASDLENHVKIVEGHFPAAAPRADGSPVEVLLSNDEATKLGLHVGESYTLFHPELGPGNTPVQIPLRVVGIWQAKDDLDDYWFYKPWALGEVAFVPKATFTGQILPLLKDPVSVAVWYLVMDGSGVRSGEAGALATRTDAVTQKAAVLLPGLTITVSPVEALRKYEKAASLLTILLYAFSVPIIGLLLAFITLVIGLTVGQQRNEIAVLRSRGGTTAQVMGIAALEALVLNALALALGWPLSEVFARLIARTQSFLNFSTATDVQVVMSPSALRFGLGMVALSFLIQMIPTLGAARHTIVTYKQERARSLRPPWWQRAWLDLLLLVPTGYGVYLLRKQGAVALLPAATAVSDQAKAHDPFQNPLLFLIPALGVFALTLLVLRLMPLVMRAVAWIAAHTRAVGSLLATRHLARVPGFYSAPLLLLVLTLSLSAFTASLAQTLDNHLYDQTYYQIGADMQVEELGQTPDQNIDLNNQGNIEPGSAGDLSQRWLFLPVAEHLKVPGVKSAARLGRYPATAVMGGERVDGTFIGIDRADFARVAFWRRDFAQHTLGALMNALATAPEAALVSSGFMNDHGLKVGDSIRVEVNSFGNSQQVDLRIADKFDLFPTWYPDNGPLFVSNLDYYFEQFGSEVPTTVLLKTGADRNYDRIVKGVQGLGLYVVKWDAALDKIAEEQHRPERQGLFGVLSVGFVAAGLLTVLGFLLYALFSFRRRSIELGMLRAVGLSAGQMTSSLVWELILLILTGLGAGTALGAAASEVFIPYLQVGKGAAVRVPPYLVEIAWPAIFRIYTLFGLLFVVALAVLAILLMRMKIYQAVKMGETV
jgi:putative ABC transport system permease protein